MGTMVVLAHDTGGDHRSNAPKTQLTNMSEVVQELKRVQRSSGSSACGWYTVFAVSALLKQ